MSVLVSLFQLSPEQLSSAFKSLCHAKECTDEPPRKSSTSAMLLGSMVGAQQLKNNENNLKQGEELPLMSNGTTAMLKEHMDHAADVISELRSGNVSTRLVASIGGAAMVVIGIMSFIGDVFSLNFINAIIQCYMVIFGAIVIVIEMGLHGKNWKWGAIISKNARFLCFVNGRGAFYFFIGTLALTEWNLLRVVLGAYMMTVGVGLVWFGYLANKKLEAINGAAQSEPLYIYVSILPFLYIRTELEVLLLCAYHKNIYQMFLSFGQFLISKLVIN